MLVERELKLWTQEVLDVPTDSFGGLPPCPYAKKALEDNKVKIHWLDESFNIKRLLNAEIENYTYHWPKNTEIVVLVFAADRLNPHEIRKIILTD